MLIITHHFLTFGVGFGPALVKYTDQKDDVEYTVRAVPAGGFVSFPKHYDVTEDGEYHCGPIIISRKTITCC